ncbi:MAG: class E sortase, partial [Actinomycetota bacterium]|nr:class E sortase [Actinomycetota bacterium]
PEANVYMAGHRLGYINTGSFLVFYDLDKLREGDEVSLADAEGRGYRYRVYDVFTVAPEEAEVMQPVEGKNILTLQTCTLPDYARRLIVRAEKVA